MLSADWVTGTEIGQQPAGTTYIPYPWFYTSNLAPVRAAGLRYRLTESNDYLTGVPGASNAFAAALWALDHLHWWAAHGAAGINFHNKQWLYTDTIVPDPAAAGRYAVTPKGYGIKAFTLGSAGPVRPADAQRRGRPQPDRLLRRGLPHADQQDARAVRGGRGRNDQARPARRGKAPT